MGIKKSLDNTGLDNKTGNTAGRVVNKNGLPNIKKRGIPWHQRLSSFHTLINLSFGKYLLLILFVYFVINVFFASIYFLMGPQSLSIQSTDKCDLGFFQNCFFFSAQTLTTVGYGRISPITFSANVISSVESLLGLLLFSVITGLSYARFAKPKSHIIFSNNILVSPYMAGKALMFRMVSQKNNILSDANAKVTAVISVEKNGKLVNEFFNLKLEIDTINSLAFNWTLVHVLDSESPFANYNFDDFVKNKVEILVFVKAYDEQYSNQVLARTSYTAAEFVNQAKFKIMFSQALDGMYTNLELQKLNDYEILA
jgi:inward rectifier potassium channel